jgi:hypothetical protein
VQSVGPGALKVGTNRRRAAATGKKTVGGGGGRFAPSERAMRFGVAVRGP